MLSFVFYLFFFTDCVIVSLGCIWDFVHLQILHLWNALFWVVGLVAFVILNGQWTKSEKRIKEWGEKLEQ